MEKLKKTFWTDSEVAIVIDKLNEIIDKLNENTEESQSGDEELQ